MLWLVRRTRGNRYILTQVSLCHPLMSGSPHMHDQWTPVGYMSTLVALPLILFANSRCYFCDAFRLLFGRQSVPCVAKVLTVFFSKITSAPCCCGTDLGAGFFGNTVPHLGGTNFRTLLLLPGGVSANQPRFSAWSWLTF